MWDSAVYSWVFTLCQCARDQMACRDLFRKRHLQTAVLTYSESGHIWCGLGLFWFVTWDSLCEHGVV